MLLGLQYLLLHGHARLTFGFFTRFLLRLFSRSLLGFFLGLALRLFLRKAGILLATAQFLLELLPFFIGFLKLLFDLFAGLALGILARLLFRFFPCPLIGFLTRLAGGLLAITLSVLFELA